MPTYDMFATREMTTAVLQLRPVGNFFRSTFFNRPAVEHNHLLVDIDIYKGQRKVAPYTKVTSKSKPLSRTNFKTGAFQIPYIKISRSLEAVQTLLRGVGENIYSTMTPLQRAARQMATDLAELNEAIDRAEELQCAQSIVNAKITIKGEEIDAEIVLGRDPLLEFTVAGADLWTAGTADIHQQLRSYARLVFSKSGFTPTMMIGGPAALDALFKNVAVQSLMDNRRMVVGALNTQVSTNPPYPGARRYGDIAGFDVWEYSELYLDDADNVEKTFIPDDSIVLASPSMRCVPHYGPIMEHGVLAPLRRFAKSIKEEDPSVTTGIVQSAPAMINHDPDATAKIKVV